MCRHRRIARPTASALAPFEPPSALPSALAKATLTALTALTTALIERLQLRR